MGTMSSVLPNQKADIRVKIFPLPGMGGRQAIAQMSGALTASGALVLPGAIVMKLFHNPGKLMDEAAARIPSMFA